MTAYEQRSYPGAAADTLLNADITSGATTFSVTPGTGSGYPDGSTGPFFVIIDWDNTKAEKIRCSGRVNDSYTVAGSGGGRGQDGTSAQAHTANAKVRACITATDVQEANRAAAQTIGQVTTKGDLLSGSGANTLARLAAGANGTIPIYDSTQPGGVRAGANPALDATATIGGVSGTSLAADRAAWTAWTPAATNVTTSSTTGHFKQTGQTVRATGRIVLSGAPSSVIEVSLPANAALPFGANDFACGQAFFSHSGTKAHGTVFLLSDGTNRVYFNVKLDVGFSDVGPTQPWTWASGDAIAFTITYEAA